MLKFLEATKFVGSWDLILYKSIWIYYMLFGCESQCLNWTEFHESLILIDWTNPNIKFRHVNNFVEGFLILSILPSTTILILKGTKRTIRRKKESFNNICLFWFFLVSLNEIKVCFPFIIPSVFPSGSPPSLPPWSIHSSYLSNGKWCADMRIEDEKEVEHEIHVVADKDWSGWVVSEWCIKEIRSVSGRPTLGLVPHYSVRP